MGWMTQVASMPEAPPLTKGLTADQTPETAGLGFFSSPIVVLWDWKEFSEENEGEPRAEWMEELAEETINEDIYSLYSKPFSFSIPPSPNKQGKGITFIKLMW